MSTLENTENNHLKTISNNLNSEMQNNNLNSEFMDNTFTYQEKARTYQTLACGREQFWECIKNTSTEWKIKSRRDIMDVVSRHDEAGISRWEDQVDYKKYLLTMQTRQGGKLWESFSKKSREERLLAYGEVLKSELPAFIFSSREFDETINKKGNSCRSRKLVGCHLNGLVMLDIDHVDNPQTIFEKLQSMPHLMDRTALVHITSSQKGLRIVFTADANTGNLADNQIDFANQLGFQPDRSCIDATRISYAPTEQDILYINEELLFGHYDEAFDRQYTPQYRAKKTQPLNHQFSLTPDPSPKGEGSSVTGESTQKESLSCADGESQSTLDTSLAPCPTPLAPKTWRGYDIQELIDHCYKRKPCKEDSNRHKESLKLATDLLVMLDSDEELVLSILKSQSWVQEIIAERNENVSQTVASALESVQQQEKSKGRAFLSKRMQQAIQSVTGKTYAQLTDTATASAGGVVVGRGQEDIEQQMWAWGEQIEALMPEYPILRDICKGLKRNQYPAALVVAGGLMMTLMTRCTYRFYHRPTELRRLNCSALIIGDPASGKSFATRQYNLFAAPILEADQKGIDTLNAYRQEMKTKGANKEKPKKPVPVIRDHPARTSNAQFVEDMVNAKEMVDGTLMQLHMLTFDTELDNTLTVQKGGSWIDKQSMQLKAFHNEMDGQAYSNIDSVYQKFTVMWNFIYTGTPIALDKMVTPQNFGSGQATRLTCVPLPSTDFQMLDYDEDVDLASDERLSAWASKLDRTKGELTIKDIVRRLYDWTARRMQDAKENNSKADEMLLKRCAYHAINFSVPFIITRHWDELKQEGDYWCVACQTDEVDWQLAELLVNMQYAFQRYFFGAKAEAYFDNQFRTATNRTQRQHKTIDAFNCLPDEFHCEDVQRCFQLSNESSARKRISMLELDHLIEKISDQRNKGSEQTLYRKVQAMVV